MRTTGSALSRLRGRRVPAERPCRNGREAVASSVAFWRSCAVWSSLTHVHIRPFGSKNRRRTNSEKLTALSNLLPMSTARRSPWVRDCLGGCHWQLACQCVWPIRSAERPHGRTSRPWHAKSNAAGSVTNPFVTRQMTTINMTRAGGIPSDTRTVVAMMNTTHPALLTPMNPWQNCDTNNCGTGHNCDTGVSSVVFTVRNSISEPLYSLLPRAAMRQTPDPSRTRSTGGPYTQRSAYRSASRRCPRR